MQTTSVRTESANRFALVITLEEKPRFVVEEYLSQTEGFLGRDKAFPI